MPNILDCVCVIHGDRYPWKYVENLHAMLCRNLAIPLNLHVFTERTRSVPDHMIRHDLEEWPEVSGSRRAWWYKMQMFNPAHNLNSVMYLDLDVVISAPLDWVLTLDRRYFWAIHDWRRLWRPNWLGINSSMMLWNHEHAQMIWQKFKGIGLKQCIKQYHGDQDLISDAVPADLLRYFDFNLVRSWRWEINDGGMDVRTRQHHCPGAGSVVGPGTSVMVFHGNPKPHELQDPVIQRLWRST